VSSIGYAFDEQKKTYRLAEKKSSPFCDELWRRDIERMI
jgi:hypothetical protein